jgi:cephalosporin-C deacetylase-like acetyl esterase
MASCLLAAAFPAQPQSGAPGPVDGYLTDLANRLLAERAAKVAGMRSPREVAERQEYIRKRFFEALGGFPERTPLNPRITGTLARDGYRVEKLIYESQPRHYVTANVYVPAGGKPPYPAILGTAGHSANGKAIEAYQRVWIALAKRGFVVLAFDPPGQGERYEYFDVESGKPIIGGTAEHTMAGTQCLLTGTNYARYELWDGIRGVDYLLTRNDVDPKRLGVAGNSGGGTQTAYLQVVEPRFAAAAPSCYLTSWEKLWVAPGPQDAEQNLAGFLRDGLDFGDFLIAFAPKPVKMMTAIRDFFPIDGARATFAEARRVYEVLGAGDRIGFFEYDDPHGWSKPRREATYAWFQKWLNGRPDDDGSEPDFPIEPDKNLYATPTGQVATSLKGETVQSLNQALAERIHAQRTARTKNGASLRPVIVARIGEDPGLLKRGRVKAAVRTAAAARQGYRVEDVSIESDGGVQIPAFVFTPEPARDGLPAVLFLNPAGKGADAAPGRDIESLVKAGNIVLAPDLRGWGENAIAGRRGGYQGAMRAILVGRTIVGMQAADALRCFDYLTIRPGIDPKRISVFGKGNGGVVALYAAALEPRIHKAAAEGAVLSYMDVVGVKLHEDVMNIVAPGVLRDFDLPDLAASVAPRPLWIVNPRTPKGERASSAEASRQYGSLRSVVIAERREGATFREAYERWIEK